MMQQEIFDSLTRNAFDFLKRGIEEFDKSVKYSIINFCAAMEMLFKARLMKEHWSLVISKPGQVSLAKFKTGEFTSVTLREALDRICNVTGEIIGNEASNNFLALARHRNKMVHFFHPEIDTDDKAREQIISEQCRVWVYLHRLLNRWNIYFRDFSDEISHAEWAMKKNRKYLTAKFKALKQELDDASAAGCTPKKCSACGYKAAISSTIDDNIISLNCLVCGHTETQVELDCPYCGMSTTVTDGRANCRHCGKLINPSDLANALLDPAAAHFAIRDGDDTWMVNCGVCGGDYTVIKCKNKHFCTNCFEIFDGVDQCRWCGEYTAGDMEDSSLFGCGCCGGRIEWEKDS
jgi:hypothetical protein